MGREFEINVWIVDPQSGRYIWSPAWAGDTLEEAVAMMQSLKADKGKFPVVRLIWRDHG